jgi:hypothetical protein
MQNVSLGKRENGTRISDNIKRHYVGRPTGNIVSLRPPWNNETPVSEEATYYVVMLSMCIGGYFGI